MIALIYALCVASNAQNILVMPLRAEMVGDSVVKVMDEVLLNEVSKVSGFNPISFAELDELVQVEKVKDILECDNISRITEIGSALNADFTLVGIVGRLQNTLVIRLTLFNNKDMTTKRSATYVNGNKSIVNVFAGIVSDVLVVREPLIVKNGISEKDTYTGVLRIISNVQVFSVFVDGKRRTSNRIPEQDIEFQDLRPNRYSSFLSVRSGNRKVRIKAPGFIAYETEIGIRSKKLTEINVLLKKI